MVSQVIIGGVPERDANGNPKFEAMLEIRNPKVGLVQLKAVF